MDSGTHTVANTTIGDTPFTNNLHHHHHHHHHHHTYYIAVLTTALSQL